jgi:hypothetical protein
MGAECSISCLNLLRHWFVSDIAVNCVMILDEVTGLLLPLISPVLFESDEKCRTNTCLWLITFNQELKWEAVYLFLRPFVPPQRYAVHVQVYRRLELLYFWPIAYIKESSICFPSTTPNYTLIKSEKLHKVIRVYTYKV